MISELERLCDRRGITTTATYGNEVDYSKQSDWQRNANPCTVQIKQRGRTAKLTVIAATEGADGE